MQRVARFLARERLQLLELGCGGRDVANASSEPSDVIVLSSAYSQRQSLRVQLRNDLDAITYHGDVRFMAALKIERANYLSDSAISVN